jgi:hypothetical protein
VTVKVNGTNNEIFLSVRAYKIKATKYADLTWSGANSENVDIYRDGTYILTPRIFDPNSPELSEPHTLKIPCLSRRFFTKGYPADPAASKIN